MEYEGGGASSEGPGGDILPEKNVLTIFTRRIKQQPSNSKCPS